MATTTHGTTTPVKVAAGALSEALLPGGSNLIRGDLTQGVIHLALGIAATLAFGPWGLVAVKAHSLAKSQTGQGLLDQITG